MYGETIRVMLGDSDIECDVFISCTPSMTSLEKQAKALEKLKKGIIEREKCISDLKAVGFDMSK